MITIKEAMCTVDTGQQYSRQYPCRALPALTQLARQRMIIIKEAMCTVDTGQQYSRQYPCKALPALTQLARQRLIIIKEAMCTVDTGRYCHLLVSSQEHQKLLRIFSVIYFCEDTLFTSLAKEFARCLCPLQLHRLRTDTTRNMLSYFVFLYERRRKGTEEQRTVTDTQNAQTPRTTHRGGGAHKRPEPLRRTH